MMLDIERTAIFESWMEAHKAILFKVARAYGASHADREDLFQEIALQVWHSVDAFRRDAAVSTWIYRIALNTAMAWRRKERKHGTGRQEIEAVTGLLIAQPGRDPRLDWIYERIAELDEVNRSLALLMLDGFSYRDMSQILGLSESNVGVKINRIKATLADQLAKEEHDGL
ncbi:MAG TPA: RNA polymerase sigma factor [Sphingobium sp.]